jgi:hypothetical protein
MSIRSINVNSFHFMLCHFKSFMQSYVIHANSCQLMSFMYVSFDFLRKSEKRGKGAVGGWGQICLPKPLITALLSGQRQKVLWLDVCIRSG